MLLAFDTATDAVTAAVHDGTAVLAVESVEDRLRHGELLAPLLSRVLAGAGVAPHELTRIAVGVGPGPFTGLRIGLVTASTMGAALGVEVVGVCSLDILAAAARTDGDFVVATDARRREVYWARYSSPYERRTEPAVDLPATVATDLPVAGTGPALYPDAFPNAAEPRLPDAAVLAGLVASERAALLPIRPLYLRRPDATPPQPRPS